MEKPSQPYALAFVAFLSGSTVAASLLLAVDGLLPRISCLLASLWAINNVFMAVRYYDRNATQMTYLTLASHWCGTAHLIGIGTAYFEDAERALIIAPLALASSFNAFFPRRYRAWLSHLTAKDSNV